ncbi:uncharacterized protein LOC126903891 isoform X2 [Daktulosphaira vitifoliae]|uniref:uncharacterized protein LOC126903891 isoform X2 n=1 Tax=Daktulosphaira vitifoliae TaxID=58002 RepID=UPI0021A9FC9A|nr:uncharacterized protein LOC126903891 isoform X2 [Daktulosphaira vitifoliae]
MGDHVYEPVTPTASTDKISISTIVKEENKHFLRIPLAEEIVMADQTESDDEDEENSNQRSEEDEYEDEFGEDEDEKKMTTDESIYEGENDNSSVGGSRDSDHSRPTKMKAFQQKCKVKADVLRNKLKGVTKRKPKQKKTIVVDASEEGAEKSTCRFGHFATLPKKLNFHAPDIRLPSTFNRLKRQEEESSILSKENKSNSRFSISRFRSPKSTSESPKPSKSTRFGASRLSIPNLRPRTWSDASKTSKPSTADTRIKTKLIEFGTYPRIFSKRRKVDNDTNAMDSKQHTPFMKRKESFRRRFFRSNHKELTPGPPEVSVNTPAATLAVEEVVTDEGNVSKESLEDFGDSDLQEVVSLSDDCSRSKNTKNMCEHQAGVIEEIDSDEFFLREKGLSRGNVHISNYLSSEIKHVFRSTRTRSVDENNTIESNKPQKAIPVRPTRTNSMRKHNNLQNEGHLLNVHDNRFNTMPKSFGSVISVKNKYQKDDDIPENIITSQTFEPNLTLPSTIKVPWRNSDKENLISHMPPKPPSRQRMANQRCSSFDTRSMIDLSRKRNQSQNGFSQQIKFSEVPPKAPLRRSRVSLADIDRENSMGSEKDAPTPPLRRSRISLNTDTDTEERIATMISHRSYSKRTPPPRPPFPGYATIDKSVSILPPQSPMKHGRKKSYEVLKSQEFGTFFTIPRSYSFNKSTNEPQNPINLPQPSRPTRAYNTLGPSRPQRRRREHEYGDVTDKTDKYSDKEQINEKDNISNKGLNSGDIIEKMKLRPLPSPPPPPRKAKTPNESPILTQRRYTDSALTPFLGQRETSVALSDISTDVSQIISLMKNGDVSIAIQTDPLPAGYELDDNNSYCESVSENGERSISRTSVTADRTVFQDSNIERMVQPASKISTIEQHSALSNENSCVPITILPSDLSSHRSNGMMSAQSISVKELEVGKITVADIRGQRLDVNDITGSSLKISQFYDIAASSHPSNSGALPRHNDQNYSKSSSYAQVLSQIADETMSVHSRISSTYPEVDSDEDRTSIMGVPTPPRRRSKPPQPSKLDSSAINDPSITELSFQLFKLCYSNVCSLFTRIVQQVVPDDTEKRRDLQAALCFLSIVLAGLLILGFGNEKTIHHHHWDFQFPPANQ